MATLPQDPSQGENTYVFDAESATETARLMHQDRLITLGMGGPFPEKQDFSSVHRILDIACGPGGWVLDVAYEHPKVEVVGIDISQTSIDYARGQARTQGLDNAHFKVMDILKPLDFPDDSFDLVNARLLFAVVPPEAWPDLMKECMRILRPGGKLRLTEMELGFSNNFAVEKVVGLLTQALSLAKRSFSPDGRRIGIVPVLPRFLRDAGCQQIECKAHAIDISSGAEFHGWAYQDVMVVFQEAAPLIVGVGLTTQEGYDELYNQMLAGMMSDDFCSLMMLLTVRGEKPVTQEEAS